MSIINDIMNPSNLLEVDDDQFRVKLLTTPLKSMTIKSIEQIDNNRVRITIDPHLTFTPKPSVVDCDATTCEDCNAKDCPLYTL